MSERDRIKELVALRDAVYEVVCERYFNEDGDFQEKVSNQIFKAMIGVNKDAR